MRFADHMPDHGNVHEQSVARSKPPAAELMVEHQQSFEFIGHIEACSFADRTERLEVP